MKSLALPATLLALSIPAAHGAVLLDDSLDGPLNTSAWTFGSNGGLGTATFGSGSLTLDVNQETNSARAAILTDTTNFNPFTSPLTVSIGGIALGGNPGATSFNSLYSVIGRLPTDVGGEANAGLAASYSSGGNYGTGGAFGVGVLAFASSYRIQVLDSGSSVAVKQVQMALTGVPTDMSYTVDGANATWTLTVTGATFTGAFLANGLSASLVNSTTITGSLFNFTASSLNAGEGSVSRFALGANNGTGVTDGAMATFGSVLVTDATSAIPEPSSFALLASAFVGGLAITRRRRR